MKPTAQRLKCPHLWTQIQDRISTEEYYCQMCLMGVRLIRNDEGDFESYEITRSQAKITF